MTKPKETHVIFDGRGMKESRQELECIIRDVFSEVKRLKIALQLIDAGGTSAIGVFTLDDSLPVEGTRLAEIINNHNDTLKAILKDLPNRFVDFRCALQYVAHHEEIGVLA